MKLTAITLDCPDPGALATFCQQATGLELHPASDDDFVGLTREDGLLIGFQRADGYQPPSWPGQSVPQQLHLDFEVDDLDEAEARVFELGAAKPEFQPGSDRARVFTDPAGIPSAWPGTHQHENQTRPCDSRPGARYTRLVRFSLLIMTGRFVAL